MSHFPHPFTHHQHISHLLVTYESSLALIDISVAFIIRRIQVSFAEYSLFYRALLQKRPIITAKLGHHSHTMCRANTDGEMIGLFSEYSLFYRALLQKRPIITAKLGHHSHTMCRANTDGEMIGLICRI